MESSLGFMAVFAVSGSVVFLASQFHKRLLSDYLDKFELEIRTFKNSYSIFYFVNLIMNNLIMVRFIFYIFFCFRIAGQSGDEEEGEIRGGCGGAVRE